MYIQRNSYLEIIRSVTGKNVIKVPRDVVGKSTILKQIQDQLLSDVPQEQIISINFELMN